MIIKVFYDKILKEFYFRDTIDSKNYLCLYSYETGLSHDIEFFIDINNGDRKITGKNIFIVSNDNMENEINSLEYDKAIIIESKLTNKRLKVISFESNEYNSCFAKYIVEGKSIKIGKDGDIIYSIDSKDCFSINYDQGKAFIVPYYNMTYINGKLTDKNNRIRFGDIICCGKLKIIYLGNIIAVNNPEGKVVCNLRKFKYITQDGLKVESEDIIEDDYEEDVFSRSPRITHKLISEDKDIDPPPVKRTLNERPLLYAIGPSFTMSLAMIINVIFMVRANTSGRSPIPSAIMAASMFMGAVLWPVLARRSNKKQEKSEEEKRVFKYREYIESVDKEIADDFRHNRAVYAELFPPIEDLIKCVAIKDRTLWDHVPGEDGFLDIRTGKGIRKSTININVQRERFSLEDDPMRKYASLIQQKYEYIDDVPVSVKLNKISVLGVVGNEHKRTKFIKLMIARLAITHCYNEVKIALLYNKRENTIWNFTKWLPHCRSNDKKVRIIANENNGAHFVMRYLKDVYDERVEMSNENRTADYLPHYVVFITDSRLINRDSYLKSFIENSSGYGFTFVLSYNHIGQLPSNTQNIIQLSEEESTIYDKAENSGNMMEFTLDSFENETITKMARAIAKIKVSEIEEEIKVPESLSFFGLYKAKNLKDLAIERRWKESKAFKSLEAPIGMGSGEEVFALNIHEKYHGPHGLIAGTTGSGKSELIQSLILSLAINYHPYDVAFVLIDYKGGGMANAFKNLPHVVGTITNLEGNQIKRSLISLKSELKRRQAIFKECNVNHIDIYQEKYKNGQTIIPLPHLIIIADEFAELKSQEPEFMNELISTARIGRSLGVHLILATQKPSGVVNDQIWSNTRFRICLKVAEKTDSKEMLKRDDASNITIPGRCYVQIGNDEIFKLIQSSYSGEKYVYNGSNINNENKPNVIIEDLQGSELYRLNELPKESKGPKVTQLFVIVEYLKDYAQKQGIIPLSVGLPPLPEKLVIFDIERRTGGFDGNVWQRCNDKLCPIIGLYDEPERQNQAPVEINFPENGHVLLYGAPGTGKTIFLQTLITALARRYSPDLANMYILDFGSRSLGYFKTLPHIGDVLFSDDEDKVKRFFDMVIEEFKSRQKSFSKIGVGSMTSYLQSTGENLPALFIIIDNYASFSELYTDYDSKIIKLARDGGNYGIYLIFTCTSVNGVKKKIAESFKTMLTLQLNDRYDYSSVFGRIDGVLPDNVKGRGLVRIGNILEFQTALATDEINEAKRVSKLKEEFMLMAEKWKGKIPKPIPSIPDDMSYTSFTASCEYAEAIKKIIPLGYDTEKIEIVGPDPYDTPIFNIYGDRGCGKTNLLSCIIRSNKDRDIWLVDNTKNSLRAVCGDIGIHKKCDNAEELNKMIIEFVNELVKRHNDFKIYRDNEKGTMSEKEFVGKYSKILFIIDDFDNFYANIGDTELSYFKQTLGVLENLGVCMIVSMNSGLVNKYKSQVKEIFNTDKGIILGSIDSLSLFGISVPYSVKKDIKTEKGVGYLVKENSYITVKIPFDK